MHYFLPPKNRLINAQLDRYVRDQLYWVLHAPRQTGKTTFLQTWMQELNTSGTCIACYVTVERCQQMSTIDEAMPVLVDAICEQAAKAGVVVPTRPGSDIAKGSLLSTLLSTWAAQVAPLPLVVLFDEVDVLEGQAMISFLRQLRGGFATRGIGKFPVSVALVGMRDLKDYLVNAKDGRSVNPGSPFNIKHSSATLENFTRTDIADLYAQHTADTGQAFTTDAIDAVMAWTSGQPWLVNALAEQCCYQGDLPAGTTITRAHLQAARDALIRSRAVHIDSLAERLKDPRVREVVQPILIGASDPELVDREGFRLCQDLGLVALIDGSPAIANAMYREVLARTLSWGYQNATPAPDFRWQTSDGGLDMEALMAEFQHFWRRNSAVWEVKADYPEAFPHLLLMAFLQRVINGGGQIAREYAAGRGRLDLAVTWRGAIHAIEIKLVHPADGLDTTRDQGLQQIARYADTLGATTRTLVIFDRRPEARAKPWAERLTMATNGPTLVVTA
jgi:hypothetical protein